MGKKVVFITGCSGNVGAASVQYLSAKYQDKFEIRAGTRDPEKCGKLKNLKGVQLVQVTSGDQESFLKALTGVDYLFLIPPQASNRTDLTLTILEAAKDAGVKHVTFLSVFYADQEDTVFGKHYKPLETRIKTLGTPYTVLRVMMFIDNHFGLKDVIASQSQVMFPVDPDRPYTPVAIQDICRGVGAVLRDPDPHHGRTYHLASDRFSLGELTKEFSAALEKEIEYVHVSYDAALEAFLSLGVFEPWQGDGLMEMYRAIDAGAEYANRADISDFRSLTGEEPTSLKTWVRQVAPIFKS